MLFDRIDGSFLFSSPEKKGKIYYEQRDNPRRNEFFNDTILIFLFWNGTRTELVEKRNRYPSNIVAIVPSYNNGSRCFEATPLHCSSFVRRETSSLFFPPNRATGIKYKRKNPAHCHIRTAGNESIRLLYLRFLMNEIYASKEQ